MSEPNEVISTIFARPKKDPKQFRVTFNLKALNQSVAYHNFKMETVGSAIKRMSKCCYMSLIDTRDAFYSIPIIAPEFRKYLKFIWNGGDVPVHWFADWASPAAPEFLLSS